MDTGKKNVMANLFWRMAERSGARIVSFCVTLVLARLLLPEVYGTVALVTVFTTILSSFVDSGMSTALVQKKDADDLDFSTAFYFNLAMSSGIYLALFILAPYIAAFYDISQLTPMIRVYSLVLLVDGVKNVQQAFVARKMIFKRFFFATLGGTVFSAGLGITMAFCGFGVWALIAQMMSNSVIDTCILWFTVKWRPKWMFSFPRLKMLFGYGWKMLASSLLDNIYNNIQQLIIGKKYTTAELAYYNKGSNLPETLTGTLNVSLDSILLPTMSSVQDDKKRLKAMAYRASTLGTYVAAPMMFGLAAVGAPLFTILYTDRWLPAVPFLRIYCVMSAFYPMEKANMNPVKALGRSDLFLKINIIRKVFGLTALLITVRMGVLAMAYGLMISGWMGEIALMWPNKKLLGYSISEQLRDIGPTVLLAAGMAVCVYSLQWLGLPDLATLLLQIVLGAAIYVGGSALLRLEPFLYLWGMVKPKLMKKLGKGD